MQHLEPVKCFSACLYEMRL